MERSWRELHSLSQLLRTPISSPGTGISVRSSLPKLRPSRSCASCVDCYRWLSGFTAIFPTQPDRRLRDERRMAATAAAAAALVGSVSPFPFYYFLWNYPQVWVNLCGKKVDPSHRMAQISHAFKIVQFFSILSVARISWPPWYCLVLFAAGQYLNFKVYHLLGETGTYYGLRFGKNIPWVSDFPFGYINDPQYVGSILSLLACLSFVPYPYVLFWMLGYLFMIHMESKEDPSTRARPLS